MLKSKYIINTYVIVLLAFCTTFKFKHLHKYSSSQNIVKAMESFLGNNYNDFEQDINKQLFYEIGDIGGVNEGIRQKLFDIEKISIDDFFDIALDASNDFIKGLNKPNFYKNFKKDVHFKVVIGIAKKNYSDYFKLLEGWFRLDEKISKLTYEIYNIEDNGLFNIKLESELKDSQEELKKLEEKLFLFYPHKIFMLCKIIRDIFGIFEDMEARYYGNIGKTRKKILRKYLEMYNKARFGILRECPKNVKKDKFYKYFYIFNKSCKILKLLEEYSDRLENIEEFFKKNSKIVEQFFEGNSTKIEKYCSANGSIDMLKFVNNILEWIDISKKCVNVWKKEIEKTKIAIGGKFFKIIKDYIDEKIEDERIYFDNDEDVSEKLNRIDVLECFLKELDFNKVKFSELFNISSKFVKKCVDGKKENL